MGRWEPDSRRRLAEAAFALYVERGFENTTVAEIAKRAGLTERTFFRHFADKREVLFGGAGALEEAVVSAVAGAPAAASPLDAMAAGLEAIGEVLPDNSVARQRQQVIAANPDLQERELIKLASLSKALAGALRERGLDEKTASLTAEVGMVVFRIAYERWIDERNERDFSALVRESLGELQTLTAG